MAIEIRLPLLPSSISLSSVGGVMMIHSSPDAFLRDKSSNPTHASSPFHTQRERERERKRERERGLLNFGRERKSRRTPLRLGDRGPPLLAEHNCRFQIKKMASASSLSALNPNAAQVTPVLHPAKIKGRGCLHGWEEEKGIPRVFRCKGNDLRIGGRDEMKVNERAKVER